MKLQDYLQFILRETLQPHLPITPALVILSLPSGLIHPHALYLH